MLKYTNNKGLSEGHVSEHERIRLLSDFSEKNGRRQVFHSLSSSLSLTPRFRDENVYLSKKIYKQSLLPTGAKDFQPGGDLISEISLGLTKLSVKQSSAGSRARGEGSERKSERERGKGGREEGETGVAGTERAIRAERILRQSLVELAEGGKWLPTPSCFHTQLKSLACLLPPLKS